MKTGTFPVEHAPATRAVRFDTPGVLRIGPYERETEYQIEAAEAERLVTVKGFTYTDTPHSGDLEH